MAQVENGREGSQVGDACIQEAIKKGGHLRYTIEVSEPEKAHDEFVMKAPDA